MNSYPPELLVQLAPIMFVAGLDVPPISPPPSGQSQDTHQDPYLLLKLRLKEALLAQRNVAVYQPEKSKTFQVLLVDKVTGFPPRKLAISDDPYAARHSPLSPLSPSSPLHPDGLIAPIWIRKHTTLVPSVFVLFLRIFESPPHTPKSPLDGPDPEKEKEKEQEERRRDTELAADIALRKKSTNERSIKLTVVLIASRRLLDDPTLDSRLTYIRRHSGLDSRAALFVLSPVSQAELSEFVLSLQQALYDTALDYYTNHSKRVRRKRNRHVHGASSYPAPMTPLGSNPHHIARPLRPEGWTVRYEYKMACFAEFRGEDEVALKHYQDAYATLCIMFGSTVMLPPRTKRWAEAKVLADCINIKVTKLYLYNNEHALALSHHSAHVRQFGDFSRGWGIGEETFEFWSWVARQHRILGELLEQGTKSTLVIPKHQPLSFATASPPSTNLAASRSQLAVGTMDAESTRGMGVNPSHALQHPGFYYYMAARCTELRKERFDESIQAEMEGTINSSSPGFVNEKKVDHYSLILELYTKSYDLFKKYAARDGQSISRLTLWIANRIAQIYYNSGKYEMAVRFFERIAKTFRREQWTTLLNPILSTWYACAQQLGDVDLSVKLLVEKIAQGSEDLEEAANLEEDLLAVLQSTVPSTPETILTINHSDCIPIFNTSLVFWSKDETIEQPAAFQLAIATSSQVSLASLPFTRLALEFSTEDIPPIFIEHSHSDDDTPLRYLKLGDLPLPDTVDGPRVHLRWNPDSSLIVSGTLTSPIPASVTISRLVLTLEQGNWKIDLVVDPNTTRFDAIPDPKWLRSIDPPRFIPVSPESSQVVFRNRHRTLDVDVTHSGPAYLDEPYPIAIEVVNTDDEDLQVSLNVLLQPTAIDHAVNSIELEEHVTSSLMRDVSFGVLKPGGRVMKTLTLISKKAAGDRMLDISIQYHPVPEDNDERVKDEEGEDGENFEDSTEILQTITIPVLAPLKAVFDVAFGRMPGKQTAVSDLNSFEDGYWTEADGTEATILTRFEFTEPWGLEIESVKLVVQENPQMKLLDSSQDDSEFPAEYLPGDEYCHVCRVVLAPPVDRETEIVTAPEPGHYAVIWRKIAADNSRGPFSTSIYPLPPLEPPMEELMALLNVPAVAHLHEPFSMSVTVRNHHPEKSANIIIHLDAEPSDSFIVAGLRSGRLPILLPDSEETVVWQVIPVDCGYAKLPKIRVLNKRASSTAEESSGDGQLVKLVLGRSQYHSSIITGGDDIHTVLVLPKE